VCSSDLDSLFTHVAFKNIAGKTTDLSFNERYDSLQAHPIQNEAEWLCFYNAEKGYAFGSIRLNYDITNDSCLPSPTYSPHTKISDGANGGKYWNRCLIDFHYTLVPAGSRYIEENAYIVFKISEQDKFNEIEKWARIVQNPIEITAQSKIENKDE